MPSTLTGLPALLTRARVLATSALSWLTAISAALAVLAQQLDGVAGVPEGVTRALASAIAVLGAIILQVRRVTPVDDDQKGLLPPKGPAVEVDRDAMGPDVRRDAGLSFIEVVLILVIVAVVIIAIKIY